MSSFLFSGRATVVQSRGTSRIAIPPIGAPWCLDCGIMAVERVAPYGRAYMTPQYACPDCSADPGAALRHGESDHRPHNYAPSGAFS